MPKPASPRPSSSRPAAPRATSSRKTRTPKATVPRLVARAKAPEVHAIAIRAYELFLEGNGTHGHDLEHWFRAERELTTRGESAA